MSRVGKLPISVPKGITINVDGTLVTVKGPKGTSTQKIDDGISVNIEDGTVTLSRATEQKRHKAMHGLYRALIANMIKGCSEGFKIEQEQKYELDVQ